MNKRIFSLALVGLLAPVICFGALLGNPLQKPVITYKGGPTPVGNTYTSFTGAFVVDAAPLAFLPDFPDFLPPAIVIAIDAPSGL